MITVNKSIISTTILTAFVIVAALSFLHFYGMIYGDLVNMQSHAPCQTYLQISKSIPQNPTQNPTMLILLGAFLGILFSLEAKIASLFYKLEEFIKLFKWKYALRIKPQLFLNFLLRKGILQPKLYA